MTTTPHSTDCRYSRPALILDTTNCQRCRELAVISTAALADIIGEDFAPMEGE